MATEFTGSFFTPIDSATFSNGEQIENELEQPKLNAWTFESVISEDISYGLFQPFAVHINNGNDQFAEQPLQFAESEILGPVDLSEILPPTAAGPENILNLINATPAATAPGDSEYTTPLTERSQS